MRNRFFAAVVRWGGFHVRGIADQGPWDRKRLTYRRESEIDVAFYQAAGDRTVKTLAELFATIIEAMATKATCNVWIHESLENETKSFWERLSNNGSAPLVLSVELTPGHDTGPRWISRNIVGRTLLSEVVLLLDTQQVEVPASRVRHPRTSRFHCSTPQKYTGGGQNSRHPFGIRYLRGLDWLP